MSSSPAGHRHNGGFFVSSQSRLLKVVELTPDVPNAGDDGFLNSMLNNHSITLPTTCTRLRLDDSSPI